LLQTEAQEIPLEGRNKLHRFLKEMPHAANRTLLLDYEGTIADFSRDSGAARSSRRVHNLLNQIRDATKTRLILVTAQRAQDTLRLSGLEQVEIWGCHGLERLRANGNVEVPDLDAGVLQALSRLDKLLTREGLTNFVEHKPAGIAIHSMRVDTHPREIEEKVYGLWAKLPDRRGLSLTRFHNGLEIRANVRNKRDVVRTILGEIGTTAAVAYLGEDQSDEDAFAALQGYGLGVLVRRQYRPTIADVWIRPPEGVIAFLGDWVDACGGA